MPTAMFTRAPAAFTRDARGVYVRCLQCLRMMGAVFTNDAYSVSPCCSFWRNRGWDCCQHAAATLEPSRIDRSNERFDRSNRFEPIERTNRSIERIDRSNDSMDRPASFGWPRLPRYKMSRAPPDFVGRSRCPHRTVFMHDAHSVCT